MKRGTEIICKKYGHIIENVKDLWNPEILPKYCTNLKSFSFKGWDDQEEDYLNDLVSKSRLLPKIICQEHNPGLERVKFFNWWDCPSFRILFETCKGLKSLTFIGDEYDIDYLTVSNEDIEVAKKIR